MSIGANAQLRKRAIMKRFDLIEHTADTGIKAYGRNLAEAFANAAYGMFLIMSDLENINESEVRRIEVKADDVEGLLFEWLNTLLYYFDVESLIFKRFVVTDISDKKLLAECYGEKFDSGRHQIKIGVKSATYHMLNVDRDKNRVTVIFDV
jgi:SHS2 domain-containing protein